MDSHTQKRSLSKEWVVHKSFRQVWWTFSQIIQTILWTAPTDSLKWSILKEWLVYKLFSLVLWTESTDSLYLKEWFVHSYCTSLMNEFQSVSHTKFKYHKYHKSHIDHFHDTFMVPL